MQFVDFALSQSDELHAGELEMLVGRGDIGLISGDAVKRLGEDIAIAVASVLSSAR